MRRLLCLVLLLIALPILAQEDMSPEVITAENVNWLQSVARIDFDRGLEAVVPEAADTGTVFMGVDTGWFALDNRGVQIAVPDKSGELYVIRYGRIDFREQPPYLADEENVHVLDVSMNEHLLAGVYGDGISAYLNHGSIAYYGGNNVSLDLETQDTPASVWLDCVEPDDSVVGQCDVYIEFLPVTGDDAYIKHIGWNMGEEEITDFPYAPAEDEEAVVRIGRIPPPYTVTSSVDGIVKLWNLQTGEPLYEVDNGTGLPAVFGAINTPPTHLVWRDSGSNTLYLLNFETGENQMIDSLGGAYVQWFFLSPDASVILAVNYDFQPVIIAWDVATGERTTLGEYRECNRPQPDMARLSEDGTTLVIGCDTGLDIWRVVSP